MNTIFMRELYKLLYQSDFKTAFESEQGILGEDTKCITVFKPFGPILYFVAVYNDDAITEEERLSIMKANSLVFGNAVKEYALKSIIVLNLHLSTKEVNGARHLIDEDKPYDEQPLYEMNWGTEIINGRLSFCQGTQSPTEILNIKELIRGAYDKSFGTTTQDSIQPQDNTLESLNRQADEESPFKPKGDASIIAFILIFVNMLIYALMALNTDPNAAYAETLLTLGAQSREAVFARGEYYRIWTAMFIHANLSHLLSNCLALYIFGTRCEVFFGRTKFLLLYFGAGLFSSICSLVLSPSLSVGASGAIFGLVGGLTFLTKASNRSILGVSFYLMLLYISINIAFGFMNERIDNISHIGGLIFGVIYGLLFIRKKY